MTTDPTELKPCPKPWNLGPARGVENLWTDGDQLLIAVDTTTGWDFALVSILVDEDEVHLNELPSGDSYTAWPLEAVHYWIRLADIPQLWNTRADAERDADMKVLVLIPVKLSPQQSKNQNNQ